MRITISGGSGFIGRRLLKHLSGETLHVLSRHAGTNLPPGVRLSRWDPVKGEPPAESLEGVDAVVHFAGAPVAQRWTPEAKRQIRESRVAGTRHLVQALSTISRRPAVLVCASAIGIYGDCGEETITEASPAGAGFLAQVCTEWEKQADLAEALGIRVVKLRTGVVLAPHGGALAKMLPAFRNFAGGTLGSGRQWMSWIHLDDLVALIRFAIDRPLSGPVNGTAPLPVRNADFTRTLAATLHRPAMIPVPGFVLRTIFGEMAEVLLASQRVMPHAAEAAGFEFRHPELKAALESLLK